MSYRFLVRKSDRKISRNVRIVLKWGYRIKTISYSYSQHNLILKSVSVPDSDVEDFLAVKPPSVMRNVLIYF
jgi:small nuclear ribonucleoprotein (snRNP)-like protein